MIRTQRWSKYLCNLIKRCYFRHLQTIVSGASFACMWVSVSRIIHGKTDRLYHRKNVNVSLEFNCLSRTCFNVERVTGEDTKHLEYNITSVLQNITQSDADTENSSVYEELHSTQEMKYTLAWGSYHCIEEVFSKWRRQDCVMSHWILG